MQGAVLRAQGRRAARARSAGGARAAGCPFSVTMRWADTRTCIARAQDEVDKLITIVQHPRQFKIPEWFLNRVKDRKVRDNA